MSFHIFVSDLIFETGILVRFIKFSSQSFVIHPKTIIRSLLTVIAAMFAISFLILMYARFIEPHWIKIQTVNISDKPTLTIIHISDIHHKGDKKYLNRIIKRINRIQADFVCFTGDMIEDKKYLDECLKAISEINKPVYGIYGNHDQWAHVSSSEVAGYFAKTGGKWLERADWAIYSNRVCIIGECEPPNLPAAQTPRIKILLNHYPGSVRHLPPHSYDLILSGHTHGGQVNIPFIGTPVISKEDAVYLKGLFKTEAGPLYVNPGLGTYYLPLRFMCRPEITVIKL